VAVLFVTHDRFLDHDAGAGHPERPDRLRAARRGLTAAGLDAALTFIEPRPATRAQVELVHDAALIDHLVRIDQHGGGVLDPDTRCGPHSLEAAMLAAGAGLTAVAALTDGGFDAAFCAVRPPGHHATPTRAMGFCLLNSIAVTAATLADAGERVAIVDFDVHHGNGTQEAFYADPRVLFVSLHQAPFYPGTGSLAEVGAGDAIGSTCNIPLPSGTTGDVYRAAMDEVVGPLVSAFAPTWLLVSAGFDGHRADPLASLALTSGDYGDVMAELFALVPRGRTVVMLEGGYDLDAVADSTAATVAALTGERLHPEPPSGGGCGLSAVAAARSVHDRIGTRRAP